MKKQLNIKKLILLNLPYILMGLFSTNFGEAWRMAVGADASAKMLSFFSTLPVALASWWPSLHPLDLLVGLCCCGGLRLAVYLKSKNAKKYRHGMEYGSSDDSVVVPLKEQYNLINEYYSTTFHELTHSTGHKNRLNRLQTGAVAAFGSETYSKEELVAEIGSATLMNVTGIETPKTFKNSAAYIQSWLKVLRNDNKFIISASSKAEKAVNYILATE